MSPPEYSSDALNVLSEFYGTDFIVYVEGEDDVAFWESIFGALSEFEVEVQDVGGGDEVDKIAERIVTENVNAVVARDADFKVLLAEQVEHPNVLHTYGYSIENSMFTDKSVHRATCLLCKTRLVTKKHCKDWLEAFAQGTKEITRIAVASRMYDLGVSVFPSSAMRLLSDQDSSSVDDGKVEDYVGNPREQCDADMLEAADAVIKNSVLELGELVQGHLLGSAALHFLKGRMKEHRSSSVLSADVLYAMAVQIFVGELEKEHPHKTHYEELIAGIEIPG